MQDVIVLILEVHFHGGAKRLDKVLMTHYVSIGSALHIRHYYIARGHEAGIYSIMFLLMNLSTPILDLRWYLQNFRPLVKKSVLVADAAFVFSFFMAVYGMY